ncbi:MAG: TMEM143 family protein [Nostoc sp. DedQUE08]|uniref:TMEM143 family protein n=1 Tax=unclassified Nostoc TaxID=2593658 RepID=UPI002AD501FF|nr:MULTISPECIES: TMEM143 family protein [unclassified Nostoc]MDZ8032582.1 TMEM143 family protein [Nostoc sp. DedSLP04]MDZ8069492.1 TMEM143 family protein [Nostoc sp. DedQUE08]
MAVSENREAFIPYTRSDIIKLCLQDGQLDKADVKKFQDFCQILIAYYHFRFHQTLEVIKDNYVPFNPNAEIQPITPPTFEQYDDMELKVVEAFGHIVERANYILLPESILKRALATKSLIELKTQVNFEDFDRLICYYRGDSSKKISVKKFFFWQEEKMIDIFERIVLLVKFKEAAYFRAKKDKIQELKFIPGKMYVYFYKNIPKLDVDLIFPNVKTSMTWKDRLLFGIPAIGAAIPLILRTLPNLLLIVAAILLVLNVTFWVESLNVELDKVRNFMPVLVAALSLAIALGGFAFTQYTNYKNKKIKFQKIVTDTLFFKNLASNNSVFQMFLELAEEEECKEIILAYYHLLTSPTPLTPQQLDSRIETWMDNKLGTKINFDIQGPLSNLEDIRGQIIQNSKTTDKVPEIPLLAYDRQGACHVLSLDEAKAVIDYVWDNAFRYNGIIL